MQQECSSHSIMTIRRACFMVSLFAALAVTSCATPPDDQPVVESLDTETGVTVARLDQPIELYRESFLQDAMGRFAFLGPFETNQMGERELYLWIALPVEISENSYLPQVEVNGTALALGAPARDTDFAGLRKSPYKIPTPWSAMYYYKVDRDLVARLGQASDLVIYVTEETRNGAVRTQFTAKLAGDSRLAEFANR
jgi:hypothetical protein